LTDLPLLPSGEAPTFREPWQAKAFALVVLLYRGQHFTWDAWVRTLAGEIAARPQHAGETAEMAYHRQFLATLETIVAARGLADAAAQAERKAAWRRAYLNTPHGHAVELSAAELEAADDDDHHLHHHDLAPQRTPVAISPARQGDAAD
jgi:nitrile hydratase accessory protein